MLRSSQEIIEPKITDETTPLLHEGDQPSKCAKVASITTEVTLGLVGLGAGVLYLGPAQLCADSETCGKWLADLLSKGFAVGAYTAGGADFSLINAYMSSKSISAFVEFIRKQQSTKAKVGKGTFIILYALSQNASLLLASLGTSTAAWQTILTVSGGAPGALFGSVGMFSNELPLAISAVNKMGRHLQEQFLNCCSPIDPVTKKYFTRMRHYEVMQKEFLSRLHSRGDHLASLAASLEVDPTQNPLAYLFSDRFQVQPHSRFRSGMGFFGKATGFGLGVIISAPFAMNTFTMLGRYIPYLSARIAMTAFLSTSSLYGNLKVTMHGISNAMLALSDIVRGKPIQSSLFQLRPKTTLMVAGFALLLSALSYAVVDVIYENEFPDDQNRARNGFRYAAMVGMDLYHLSGLFEFYKLAYSKLTRNEKERFIFLVEAEIERLHKMPLEAFIEYVEKNTAEMNRILDVRTYEATLEDEVDVERPLINEAAEDKLPDAGDVYINDDDREVGCFSRIRNWFWSSNANARVAVVPAKEDTSPKPVMN